MLSNDSKSRQKTASDDGEQSTYLEPIKNSNPQSTPTKTKQINLDLLDQEQNGIISEGIDELHNEENEPGYYTINYNYDMNTNTNSNLNVKNIQPIRLNDINMKHIQQQPSQLPPPPPYTPPHQPQPLQIPQNTPNQMVKDYFVWSIINAMCCCLVFGLVAVFYSLNTRTSLTNGNIPDAQYNSNQAKKFNIAATIIGIICNIALYASIITVIAVTVG